MIRSLDLKTPVEASPIENRVMAWFARSPASVAAEHYLEADLQTMIHAFLSTIEVSSDIKLRALIETFNDSQIPLEPAELDSYLDELTQIVVHSTHTASPRFIGHMTTALPYFVRPLMKLMTAMNQNVVKAETAKVFTPCERQVLASIHRLIYSFDNEFYTNHIQDAQSTLGVLVSGGTIANITALWCARNASLGAKDGFTGVANEGLAAALNAYGYSGAVIIGSELMHYSFEKAADVLGVGTRGLIKIPANHRNQVDIPALQAAVEQCRDRHLHIIAVVGVAGTTDAGGVDDLEAIAQIAQQTNVHFHVDAAWGGPMLFSQRHRHRLAGIEQADSVTIDAHKQMYLPMGLGMLFLRDPNLAAAIEKQAPYTVRQDSIDLGKRALEGSRSGMSLLLHAGLHLLGIKGYEVLIDEGIRKTQYLAKRITALPEFELLAEPEINILIYRYIPPLLRVQVGQGKLTSEENQRLNECNEQLQKTQRRAGRTFISRTTTHTTRYGQAMPIVALRSVIANPLTTEDDIEAVLNDQMAIAIELLAQQS